MITKRNLCAHGCVVELRAERLVTRGNISEQEKITTASVHAPFAQTNHCGYGYIDILMLAQGK